jgi:hypothetical protein
MEGVNITMVYCKNFGKCHNIFPVQKKKDPPTTAVLLLGS